MVFQDSFTAKFSETLRKSVIHNIPFQISVCVRFYFTYPKTDDYERYRI